MSKSSPKGNDSELSDRSGSRMSGISSVRADWLIGVCHSNVADTLFLSATASVAVSTGNEVQLRFSLGKETICAV